MSKVTLQPLVLLITIGLALTFVNGVAAQDQQAESQTTTPTKSKQTKGTKRGSATKKSNDTAQTPEATGDQVTTPQQLPPAISATQSTKQTDLSGTYAGTFKCDELGLTGDTTLTINGNQFSTPEGKTGRIVASTTAGYTAVALQMGEGATTPPTVISLRGRKSGDRLILTPVAGSTSTCSFMPTSTTSRRKSRSQQSTPGATGAEVASPAEVGPSPAEVTSPATPRRNTRRGSSRSRPATTTPATPSANPAMPSTPTESPIPAQTPSPSPSPMPTPVPNPSPGASPSPSPTGSPTPVPNPSPEPSPSPSPSPSPTPTPRPNGQK